MLRLKFLDLVEYPSVELLEALVWLDELAEYFPLEVEELDWVYSTQMLRGEKAEMGLDFLGHSVVQIPMIRLRCHRLHFLHLKNFQSFRESFLSIEVCLMDDQRAVELECAEVRSFRPSNRDRTYHRLQVDRCWENPFAEK